jgi:PII-like signaling protein
MKGVHLRFYTYENRKHHGLPLYDWLLERAKKMGIHGGSAFKAMAGYGRHGRLREQHFFELAGEEPVLVEFILTPDEADRFLGLLEGEKLHLFYARLPTEFGIVGDPAAPEHAPPG